MSASRSFQLWTKAFAPCSWSVAAVAARSIPAARASASAARCGPPSGGSTAVTRPEAWNAWSVASGIVLTVIGDASPSTYSDGGSFGSFVPVLA